MHSKIRQCGIHILYISSLLLCFYGHLIGLVMKLSSISTLTAFIAYLYFCYVFVFFLCICILFMYLYPFYVFVFLFMQLPVVAVVRRRRSPLLSRQSQLYTGSVSIITPHTMGIRNVVASGVARNYFRRPCLLTWRLVVMHARTEIVSLYYGDDSSWCMFAPMLYRFRRVLLVCREV